MLTGIRYKAYPTDTQAKTLAQWIGCARVIWNAKCDEDKYLRTFARKYLSIGVYPAPDQSYSQYKSDLTPWLSECPSQILRNSATIWHETYRKFFKKQCGRPVRKSRDKGSYIWLTSELFTLTQVDGRWELRIGTKRNDLGVLSLDWHRKPKSDELPKSIWIRNVKGRWTVSFSYDDGILDDDLLDNAAHLEWLRGCTEEQLTDIITPIDRGVARPVQTHDKTYVVSAAAAHRQSQREKKLKRYQRKMTKQKKGSNRREKTKRMITRLHAKTANVRTDFLHKTSRDLVDNAQVLVMEELKLKNMTKRAKPKKDEKTGKWIKNGAAAKSGLNRAILGAGLYRLEEFLTYKAYKANKPIFKVNPINTSRECAACGYTHPDNRRTQADFQCQHCGHTDNADRNAALVIRKRAIKLILDSGTELVGARKNVLRSRTDANLCKTCLPKGKPAIGCPSKKKGSGAEKLLAAPSTGSSLL